MDGNFSGIHGVALLSTVSSSNWNLEMLVFVAGRETGVPKEKPPEQRQEPTTNSLHMTPSPGIEPGPHWWEASALTVTPSVLPNK